MFFRFAADSMILLHLLFIIFVVFGAGLTFRWRWMPILHLPAVAWGIFIEVTHGVCPLTGLENHLRRQAGQAGYDEGFIEHYLLRIIYPEGLTPGFQFVLAGIVVVANVGLYGWLLWRWRASMRLSSRKR